MINKNEPSNNLIDKATENILGIISNEVFENDNRLGDIMTQVDYSPDSTVSGEKFATE